MVFLGLLHKAQVFPLKPLCVEFLTGLTVLAAPMNTMVFPLSVFPVLLTLEGLDEGHAWGAAIVT